MDSQISEIEMEAGTEIGRVEGSPSPGNEESSRLTFLRAILIRLDVLPDINAEEIKIWS